MKPTKKIQNFSENLNFYGESDKVVTQSQAWANENVVFVFVCVCVCTSASVLQYIDELQGTATNHHYQQIYPQLLLPPRTPKQLALWPKKSSEALKAEHLSCNNRPPKTQQVTAPAPKFQHKVRNINQPTTTFL